MSATDTTERMTGAEYNALLLKDQLEGDTVADIRKTLHALGYLTAVVSQRGGKGSGTTEGYPDLSVRHRDWPRGVCVLIEAKRPVGGVLSKGQRELHADGWSHVCNSVESTLAAVREAAAAMKGGGR